MDKFCRPLPPFAKFNYPNLYFSIFIYFISTIFIDKLSYIILIIFKHKNNIFKYIILQNNDSVEVPQSLCIKYINCIIISSNL